MKRTKHRDLILLGFSVIIFLMCLISIPSLFDFTVNEIPINEYDSFNRLKSSSSWNFTSLIIDDTGATGNYTWAEAAIEDWCSGLGTPESPYILNDIIFGYKTTDFAIEIRNSDAHFLINNTIISYLYDIYYIGRWDVGMKLINCTNGYLSNNYFLDVNYSIYLGNTNYTTITNNAITFGIDGISLNNSHHNLINNNDIKNLDEMGIHVSDSSHDFISGNTLESNNFGIYIIGQYNSISQNIISESSTGIDISSDYTILSENVISNCGHGVDIYGNSHLITENILNGNQIGLKFWWDVENITISDNVISGNEDYGLVGQSGSNISIIRNQISGGNEGGLVLDGDSYDPFENVTIEDNVIDQSFILCNYGKNILIKDNIGSIKLSYCENVLVTENEILYSSLGHGGQYVKYSTNISISYNTYKESFLWFDYSNNNTIKNNNFQFTELIFSDSSYNVISSNNINADQYSYAIELKLNSNYNNITDNVITYEHGGCFKQDETCSGNIIENNSCSQRVIVGFDILVFLSISGLISMIITIIYKKRIITKK